MSGHFCIQTRKRCTLSSLFSVSSTQLTSEVQISADITDGCAKTKVNRHSMDDAVTGTVEQDTTPASLSAGIEDGAKPARIRSE